ncbi:putative bifunctional diguanylate cyclase/phosphodiesterase [Pseudomonas sp. N040]|uniref:putative bifunctional diguanylate cyclase/phosphodiesterase n=1 Tax=Pseudomonas sp. N040 TaxID=2785325 RepID=UPI0018A33489|nr:bifunctional diguanylate cyclase/phosphodiesterase [Pseudomonas sp. N040]MBF7730577.1 bifunctional diguanylate cyclase/phosphodiesterase [Pseudomonas sp. N040]MBW7014221.1 bifunctional diguanylate cyclase/phosphodiesterase [Pseudomonas sp. N040]
MESTGIDTLTGLLDRQGCLRTATRLTANARRSHQPLIALWLNIDRFRTINGSLGISGGDAVIAKLASRMQSRLQHRAHLARMGSDDFLLLASGFAAGEATLLAAEVMALIKQPMKIGSIVLHPTCSMGLASLEYAEPAEIFLQRTEHAMFEAKRQGGDQMVVLGDEQLPEWLGINLAREELEVEHKLHAALENNGLYLQFQPILRFDGQVESVEALMRCTINGELIPPNIFIPVAEKTGLIVRLGEWCLMKAAMQAKHLSEAGINTKIAVNVSRAQLTAPKFSKALYNALVCSGVAPELIELEITESLFMDVSDQVQNHLRDAIEMGVSLSIDDFGTGYSCLATLKDIPATKLKIDRAFVAPLPEDQRGFALVKAITQLGRELGMTVVAEGVENPAQLEKLREAGVDAIQGFLHSRPMNEDQLLDWLLRQKKMNWAADTFAKIG